MSIGALSSRNTKIQKRNRNLLTFALVVFAVICLLLNPQLAQASGGDEPPEEASGAASSPGGGSSGADGGGLGAPAAGGGIVPDAGGSSMPEASGAGAGSGEGATQGEPDASSGEGSLPENLNPADNTPGGTGAEGASTENNANGNDPETTAPAVNNPGEGGPAEEGTEEGQASEGSAGGSEPETGSPGDHNPEENFVDPYGTVYDAITKQVIDVATVVLEQWDEDGAQYVPYGDKGGGQPYETTNGKYKFDLAHGYKYQITASASGYHSYAWIFDQDDDTEHKIDFYLSLIVSNISFGWASFDNEVTINHNLYTGGRDLEIRAPDGRGEGTNKEAKEDPFESITVSDGVVISTRNVGAGGNHESGTSYGNSGNIKMSSPHIIIGKGAKLFAHAINADGTSFAAGDITLEALAGAGTDVLDILVANVDHPKTSIIIKDDAILKGKIVTLTAKSDCTHINIPENIDEDQDIIFDENDTEEDIEAKLELAGIVDMGTELMQELVQELALKVHGGLEGFNLIGGVAISRATSLISVGAGSLIEAESFNANSEATINASAKPIAIGVAVAVAIGKSDAQVILNGQIKTIGDCTISALADNTMVSVGNSAGIAGFGAGAAVSILSSECRVKAYDSAVFEVGGNLSLLAKTIDRTYTRASSATASGGKVGIAVAIGIEDGLTEACLGGTANVAGNISVLALMEEDVITDSVFFGILPVVNSGVNAIAGVNQNLSSDVATEAQKAINNKIMEKFLNSTIVQETMNAMKDSFKKADAKTDDKTETSSVFPVAGAAAVAYYQDTNRVVASIAENAKVKAKGKIDVHAKAKNKPAILSTGAAKAPKGGSNDGKGTEGESAKFAGSAAVAVGIFENEVTACIGKGAEVDAANALTVRAEYINDYELKYGVELIECLTKVYINSQETDKIIKSEDIVEVAEGHAEDKGEAGNLYKYIGTNPVNINAETDYTDKDLWEDLGAAWAYRRTELLETLAANYLGAGFGLSKAPNFWVQSAASGAEVGVSGSVAVLISDNDVQAFIGENAKINQDTDASYRTGLQKVEVMANLVDETVTFSGNIVLPGVYIDKHTFNLSFQMGGSGTEADTAAVGASVIVYLQENESRAEIWDGVVLFADGLDVLADTKVLNVVVSAAGGEAGKFAFEGTFTLVDSDNTTVAWVANTAMLELKGDLTLKATDHSYLVNIAGVLSESGNVGIGASIGLNNLTRVTKAVVGPAESVGYLPSGLATGLINLSNKDAVIEALNDGYIISASVAGTVVKDQKAKPGDAKKPPKEGEEGGNYGVGISANVSINTIQDEVIASIKQAALNAKSTRVASGNYTQVIAAGGTVAIVTKEGTSAALAGAYAQNTITNKNKAMVEASKLTLTEDLTIETESSEKIIAVSASGSGSTSSDSGSVAGQVSVNIISSLTEASLRDSRVGSFEDKVRNITITASDRSSILAIAGALAYGGKAGIGAAVAWNQIKSIESPDKPGAVTAFIQDSDVNTTGDIKLLAQSANQILAVTAAAGASKEGMAAALSVSMNLIDSDTQAYIAGKKSGGIDAGGALTIEAANTSSIIAAAGNVTYSKTASIGIAGSYNEISGVVKAFIGEENTLTLIKAHSLNIQALSDAYIFSVSAGGSFSSGQTAVNGSISINTITNNLGAHIKNSTVEVANFIDLTAKDSSEIISIAGAVGGSQSVAVGAALAVNYIGSFGGLGQPKFVYAYIEDSRVEVTNGALTISAQSESVIKSISAAGGGSSNTAVFGAVSLNFINTDIAAYIKDCSLVRAQGNISLTALDKSTIYVAAGNVAGAGTASVGASIAISYIGNGDPASFNKYITNREYGESEPSASFEVQDEDYDYDAPDFIETSKVRVYIENSTVNSQAGSLQLKALSEGKIVSIAAGTAVAGTAGVQGSVSVNYSYSNVWVQILNSTVTVQNNIALEALSQGSSVQSLAGTVSGGGIAGVGIALAVNHMANSYLASIENSVVTSVAQGLALKALNDAKISSLSASGGGGQVGVNGSVSINSISSQVQAYIKSSTVAATQDIELLAYDYSEIGSIAGTVAGGYYAAVGASVAVNYIGTAGSPHLVQAYILNSEVSSAAGKIILKADANSIIKSISAAGGGAIVGANGAVSVNWIYTNTAAFIKNEAGVNREVTAKGDITLEAIDRSSISVIAGSISGGGVGAGASVAVVFVGSGTLENGNPAQNKQQYKNDGDEFTYNKPTFADDSKVAAFIENATVKSTDGSVTLTAKDNTAVFNISAGVAAGGAGWQGSVSVNYISTGILAYIDSSNVEVKNDIKIQALTEERTTMPKSALQVESEAGEVGTFHGGAEDEGEAESLTTTPNSPEKLTNIQSVAGSVAGGGLSSLGIAVAVNYMTNNYQAYVIDSTLEAGRDIIIEADNLAGIETVSAAAGGAAGEALGGSVSFNLIESTILAHITSSDLAAGSNIKLLASDGSAIKSVSGQVNFSGSQGLGAAAAYNQISNTVKAYVDQGPALAKPVLNAANNIEILSKSAAIISTIAASGSLSSGLAGSATLVINITGNTVSAYVADAEVSAENNIYLLAQSLNETNSYGGSVGGGGAVGVGAAAIVNVLNNDTEAYIIRSTVIAKGEGVALLVPAWDADGKRQADENLKGLFIIAHNKEAITVYSAAAGVGSLGASGQISTNIIKNTTKAYIDSSTINNEAHKGKLVIIRAVQDSGLKIYTGSLAAGFAPMGGVALGGAVDATIINNNTQAYIKDATVYAGSGVEVTAITSLKPLAAGDEPALVIAGAALSNTLSLAGAVSVVVTDNTNLAYIENSDLYSLGHIKVLASHNIEMAVYGGTLSGSTFVGAGGTVIVSSFTNSSKAEIRGSNLSATGALELLARSRDEISIKVGTAGVGGVSGVAGAVSVTLVETTTEASVLKHGERASLLNQDRRFKPGGQYAPTNGSSQLILIQADNKTEVKTLAGSLGAGGLGVGAALDYTSIQNRTVAMIGAGSKVYAAGDITLEALSDKIVDAQVYSAGGGLIGISGAVSIVTVGTPISQGAADEFSADLKNQIDNDTSCDSLLYYKDDDGNQVSRLTNDEIGRLAEEYITNSNLPQANVSAAIDPNLNPEYKITAAFVENAADEVERAEIEAGGKVNIHAKNINDLSSKADNTAVGAAAAGGTACYIFAADNAYAYLGAYGHLRAENIAVKAETFIKAEALGEAVAGALIGANAYVAYSEVRPVTMAYIGEYADLTAAKAVQIGAETTPQVSAEIKSVGIGVVGTAGASMATAIVNPVVKAYIGDHVRAVAANQPISGKPELTLVNQLEISGNPDLTFLNNTIRIEGEFEFVRGVALSGEEEIVFNQNDKTITRSGSWRADGFSAGDTVAVAGTRYNDGEYVIEAISEDGKELTLASSPALTDETYDGQRAEQTLTGEFTLSKETVGETEAATTRTVLKWISGDWAAENIRVGDELVINLIVPGDSQNSVPYIFRVLAIEGDKLIVNESAYLNLEDPLTITGIEHHLIPGTISIVAKGKEHDRLIYKGSDANWRWDNRGIYNPNDGDNIIAVFVPGETYIPGLNITLPYGPNSGAHNIIRISEDGKTAILDTKGWLTNETVENVRIVKDNPSVITRSSGSWLSDGFAAGQIIYISGATKEANNGYFDILEISEDGKTIRLAKGQKLEDETLAAEKLIGATENRIVRDSGSWLEEGFEKGQKIRLIGSAAGNDDVYEVLSVSSDGKVLMLSGNYIFSSEKTSDLLIVFEAEHDAEIKINAGLRLPESGKTAQAKASGVSAAGLSSVNGVRATVMVKPDVMAYIGSNIKIDVDGQLEILATALSNQRAEVDTTNIGGLVVAANMAKIETDSKIEVKIGEDSQISGFDLKVKASGDEKSFAKAKTGSGGLAGGAVTKAETENKNQTLVFIAGDALISARIFEVLAEHMADYNSQVDTFSVTVVGGGGSLAKNTVDSDVKIFVAGGAAIEAYDIYLAAKNASLKDWLPAGVDNVRAAAGAIAGASVAESESIVSQFSTIDIGAASLKVIGSTLFPGSLTMDTKNIITARDRVNLETAAAINLALAESIIEAFSDALINIHQGADLESVGDINLTALTIADIEAKTKIKTFGGAPAAVGKSIAEADVENKINVHGNLYSEGKINLLLGQDTAEEPNLNSISVISLTSIDNGGAAPLYTDPDVKAILNLHNLITIGSTALLQSVSDTNLLIEKGTIIASGKGEGTDWIRSTLGAEISVYQSTLHVSPLITVDGTIRVGISSEQLITIDKDGDIITITVNGKNLTVRENDDGTIDLIDEHGNITESVDGITFTVIREILESYMMDELALARQLAIEYAGTEAGDAFAGQVAFLEAEMKLLGYTDSGGKPLPIWVDIIIIGPVKAEQGSINVLAEGGSLVGSGKLIASDKTPRIEIINNSPAYLELEGLIIPEHEGGRLIYNYALVPGSTAGEINSGINSRNVDKRANFTEIATLSNEETREIRVENTSYGEGGRAPDIKLMGPVQNIGAPGKPGLVWIESQGGISAYSSLDAGDLHLEARGRFSQSYLDTFFDVGGSPRAHWSSLVNQWQGTKVTLPWVEVLETWYEYPVINSLVDGFLPNPQEGVIRAENIFIAARYLNINGTIEAGSVPETIIFDEATNNLINYYQANNTSAHYRDYPLGNSSYYDPLTGSIIVEELAVRGGYIQLFGQIINTSQSGGKIISFDGYGDIKIDNQTGYDLIIKGLDTGLGRSGIIVITDTSKKKPGKDDVYLTTKYERIGDEIIITTKYSDGSETGAASKTVAGRVAEYEPTQGYRFEWVMGQRMVERRVETYRSKSWLGADWLAKDPDDLFETYSWKDGEPVLMPEGEYLILRDGAHHGNVAFADIPYLYWYEYRQDAAERLIDHHKWSEQSWFAAPVWYYDQYTYQKGYIEVYYHSIRADYPIAIEFAGHNKSNVEIKSADGKVIIDGTIRNATGLVEITTNKNIEANTALAIASYDIRLKAGTGIGLVLPIGVELMGGIVSAETETGDINIRALTGSLPVGKVNSKTGNVSLVAVNDLVGSAGSEIKGSLVELLSSYGGIYGNINGTGHLFIAAGTAECEGLIAQAQGDIKLSYREDLRVISIISASGDISIHGRWINDGYPVTGYLLDGKNEYTGNADLLALWPQREYNTYTAQEIQAFLEDTHRQQVSDTNYRTRLPNISGRNISFDLKNGGIGQQEKWRIDFVDGKVMLTAEMATILAGAIPTDVLFHNSAGNVIYDLDNNTAAYMIVLLNRSLTVEASGVVNVDSYRAVYLDSDQDLNLGRVHTSSSGIGLKTKGNIYSASTDGSSYIRGGTILLEAAGGLIGKEAAPLMLIFTNTYHGSLTARAGDAIYLNSVEEEDNNSNTGYIALDYVYAPNLVNLEAAKEIRDFYDYSDADRRVNIVTANLIMKAESIGSASNLVEIILLEKDGNPGLIKAEARAGGIFLEELEGNLNLGLVEATGDVILKAAGSIINSSADADIAMIKAAKAELVAGKSLGSALSPLLLHVGCLEAKAEDGGVWLQNDGPLTIGDVSGALTGLSAQGPIYLIASKGITIKESITALGEIVIIVPDTLSAGDDILVTENTILNSWEGYILLKAGDNLTLEKDSLLQAKDTVSLFIDHSNADPGIGGILTLSGTINASSLTVAGNEDGDLFYLSSNLTEGITGDTLVKGQGGDDIFCFADGVTIEGVIDGGPGLDTLDYSAYQTGIVVNLTEGSASNVSGGATQCVINIENVTGGSGNDTITGDDNDNILRGGPGNDSLYGIGGNNILDGGDGNDHLEGGGGDDILITGSGQNTLIGGLGYDTAITAAGSTYIYEGNDIEVFISLAEGTEAHIVTFHANYNGGTVTPPSKIVYTNQKYGELPELTRTGYTFEGWFTQENGGALVTAGTIVNISDIQRLYAQWTANEYTVNFEDSGGTVDPASIIVTYDATYGELPIATRTGYTFEGWFTEVENGTQITADSTVNITSDQVLYARWTANQYELTLEGSGGTVDPASIVVTYDGNYSALPIPIRKGYDFVGWFTAAEGGSQIAATSTVTTPNDQTLYARWTPAELDGTVNISGAAKYGETLTADASGTNNTGNLSYQWKRDGENIEGATSDSYALGLDDIGKTITCVVTSDIQTASLASATNQVIEKADGPKVTGVSKTNCKTSANKDGALVGVTSSMEYKLSTAAGWTDGDGSDIKKLTKGTYYVRVKETDTHSAGPATAFIIAAYRPPSSGTYYDWYKETGTHNTGLASASGAGAGGSSASENGGSLSAAAPAGTPVLISGGGKKLPLAVNYSGGTASVEPLGDAELQQIVRAAEAAGKPVVIDLSALGLGELIDKVIIPGSLLTSVAESNSAGLMITMPDGVIVSFDQKALAALVALGSGDLTLMVRNVPTDELTDRERSQVGSNAMVIDLTVYVGEVQVSDLGGGQVTVSIPASGEPMEHLIVWHMITDADGSVSLEALEGVYNPDNNSYQFRAGSISKYAIGNHPFNVTPN